jgi:predicted RecB family nuclease
MQHLDARLILSATDLINYLECPHLTHLDIEVAIGRIELEPTRTDATALVARKGDEHERAYLAQLRTEGREVVEIEGEPGLDDSGSGEGERGLDGLRRGAKRTVEAMQAGAELIYQGVLFDGVRWRGYSDLLQRVERPSELGSFSYEVADTKLARRVKPYFLLQLCFYSELVAAIQGVAPERMHVVLGTRESQAFRVAEYAAYYRSVKQGFEEVVDTGLAETYPEPVEHCGLCRWEQHCVARREADEHLSLVANIQRSQRVRLNERGIVTLGELASAEPADRPPRIGKGTFETLRAKARLQQAQRTTGELSYELLEPAEGCGFARLPEPSEGDMFFDMEGDPFFDEGLEYLFGCVVLDLKDRERWAEKGPDERVGKDSDGRARFQAFWATDRVSEKQAFEQFIDFVIERLERFPDLHVYHYAAYEATALKRLMGLHATREDEVDRLLRGKVLVDLLAVVRQGLRSSQPNYSIKSIEAFYMGKRVTEVAEGGDSIIVFEQFLETGDRSLLEEIERYNEDDCRSTHLLREWLLGRRVEAIQTFGREIPWKSPPDPWEPDPELQAELEELQAVLLRGLPEDTADQDDDQHGRWLIAQLLDYHRREAKPGWWAYFERLEADEEQLTEVDSEALGGLKDADIEPFPHPRRSRSLIHTLRFPVQEHKVGAGSFIDPATAKGVTVESLDNATGRLRISRAAARVNEPLPRALIPGTPYGTDRQRAALRRFASDIVEHGLHTSEGELAARGDELDLSEGRPHAADRKLLPGDRRYRALREILMREVPATSARPRGAALQMGGFDLEDAKEIAEGLDGSYLFIQGPPGSGKTYTGAQLILHLIKQGQRVGVAAGSHAAIHNLLAEVECYAPSEEAFRGLKKYSDDGNRYESKRGLIENSKELSDFAGGGFDLVAGTAWLFCSEELDGKFDYLFIDEAGQISLADALAIGTCARNVVLLGDPQQLAQVSQAVHPPGAGVSVLEHLLKEDTTIPPERGLFIDETRRMHPDVCRFISQAMYEGRLESFAGCAGQGIDAPGELTGTGVRYMPVTHEGNTRSSTEEAERIKGLIEDLLRGKYEKAEGTTDDLEPSEIMVVAPYNAQVRCLREHLPDGVRVGTVDKFQGQEAAVCFFSMATSSGEEIPRHVEFLFSRNRLNVAVSRARCLAVLVCSPELLHIRCRNAEQMRLVNALCWFGEMAGAS